MRRLACGLLLSLLVHAFILSLQFGLPGMALQGVRSAINVTLAPMPPNPVPQLETALPEPEPPASSPEPLPPARVSGMTLVDPKSKPAPAKPRKARRVSTPLPVPEAEAEPRARVITQDSNPESDFAVPLPQPEESVQKTIDPAEAQHGSDEVAAAEEEATPAAEPEQPLLAARKADEERIAAAAAAAAREREILEQQRLAQEMAERTKSEELQAQQQQQQQQLQQQRRAQEAIERQKSEALLAQQLAERQRLAELAAQRQAQEAARQQALREREPAQLPQAPAGDPFGLTEGQGGSGRTKGAAQNYGSDLSHRVRELSKGLDLLTGAPPARVRANDERQRRVVAGSAERDVPLRMYVESWRQKIQRNGRMNFPKRMDERARIDPLVSVAVRSDGSIEDVTIVRSSGRQDIDDAVRRIVRINAPYSKFPPNVAARYDVIEIRRVWTFDQVLKLIEELR
jgi:TonB family protein